MLQPFSLNSDVLIIVVQVTSRLIGGRLENGKYPTLSLFFELA